MSEPYVKLKGQPDLIRSLPLAHNNFFQINKSKLIKLTSSGILRIDDIFDEDGRRHSWNYYWNKLKSKITSQLKLKDLIGIIREVQTSIPTWMLKIMRRKRLWQAPYIAGWSDTAGDPIYGVAINDELHELHVNDS
eukprot:1596080-Pleurochrysis_carterae.AAC.1